MNYKKIADNFYICENQNGFKKALRDIEPNYKNYNIHLYNIKYPCIVSFEVLFDGGYINCYGLSADICEKFYPTIYSFTGTLEDMDGLRIDEEDDYPEVRLQWQGWFTQAGLEVGEKYDVIVRKHTDGAIRKNRVKNNELPSIYELPIIKGLAKIFKIDLAKIRSIPLLCYPPITSLASRLPLW